MDVVDRSLIDTRKKARVSAEPWRTPALTEIGRDRVQSTRTEIIRLLRKFDARENPNVVSFAEAPSRQTPSEMLEISSEIKRVYRRKRTRSAKQGPVNSPLNGEIGIRFAGRSVVFLSREMNAVNRR